MTARNPVPIGDDIENALSIIEENGGAGEYETGEGTEIQRWNFPRFDGATDPGDLYLSRVGIGDHDTDVETICAWLEAPRNIVGGVLLLSEPGTGKTALVEAAATHAESRLDTHVCSPDDTRDSLYLRFVGEDHGDCITPGHDHTSDDEALAAFGSECNRSPYTLGVIPRAARDGAWLYLDEAPLLADGVKPAAIYALADGRRYLPGGNIDGSALEVHENFRLIITGNPQVRGASMPEPIASRFASTTLTIETSASMLEALGIDESVVAAWSALKTAGLWAPQIRELRMADYWLSVDIAQAVSAFLPEHAPESEREAIKNTVVSLLGGGTGLRKDGRLVVS